jgi:hypothetical protein
MSQISFFQQHKIWMMGLAVVVLSGCRAPLKTPGFGHNDCGLWPISF